MFRIPAKFTARIKFMLATGVQLIHLLYVALVSKHPVRFACAILLNFLGRLFSLASFVVGIQSIYIAFQSSISHGGSYKGKAYIDMLGLSETSLPWALAGLVALMFAMPALLKRVETRLISQIAKENHRFAQTHKVMLLSDLFITQRGPTLMIFICKLFSGMLFILAALYVVATFRFDLFLLVLVFSATVGCGVVAIGLRNIINVSLQPQLRAEYVASAKLEHGAETDHRLYMVRSVASPWREKHFQSVLKNWTVNNRAAFNQVIFTGLAIAGMVLFIFSLDDMDGFDLFLLLYLVIAIRFALNTAREVGVMATKVLEVRLEKDILNELFSARKGLEYVPPPESPSKKRKSEDLEEVDLF